MALSCACDLQPAFLKFVSKHLPAFPCSSLQPTPSTTQAYELLELYLELVAVRGPLIASSKELPRDMIEAISSIVYASSRVPDLPELATLHKMVRQCRAVEGAQA